MKRGALFLQTVLLVLILSTAAFADMPGTLFGIRGGMNSSSNDEHFQQYELFADYPLPWSWELSEDTRLQTVLNGSLGTLHGGGDTGVLLAVGPGLALSLFDNRLILDGGIQASGMTENEYGDEDLGSYFNFISHAGLTVRITDNWFVGYRFSHMSNLGMARHNPGLDMHMFSIAYRF